MSEKESPVSEPHQNPSPGSDYLTTNYNEKIKPLTDRPQRMARYLVRRWALQKVTAFWR